MQRNFILADVMKTGHEQDVTEFIRANTMADQSFDITGQYYDLHLYDLESYDRKFALIDFRFENRSLSNNTEFNTEYMRRVSKLRKQGFAIIQSSPWESTESNSERTRFHPNTSAFHRHEWWGDASWWWWYCARKHRGSTLNFNHQDKKFDFLYLNKVRKRHREVLWYKLRSDDLLDNSLFTFHQLEAEHKLPPEYELPWVDRSNYPMLGFDQDVYEKPYNDCAINVVSESVVNSMFITEKVYKPLMAGQIFMVLGFTGILKKLRSLGFKTYESVIDESYDNEPHYPARVEMISNELHRLKGTDYKKLYADTKHIREHNQKIFFDKTFLGKEIDNTLRLWFEFADSGQVSPRKS